MRRQSWPLSVATDATRSSARRRPQPHAGVSVAGRYRHDLNSTSIQSVSNRSGASPLPTHSKRTAPLGPFCFSAQLHRLTRVRRSSKWLADLQPSRLIANQAPHVDWQSLRPRSCGYEFREWQHCPAVTPSPVRMNLVVLRSQGMRPRITQLWAGNAVVGERKT
jgi:hypothetical protein